MTPSLGLYLAISFLLPYPPISPNLLFHLRLMLMEISLENVQLFLIAFGTTPLFFDYFVLFEAKMLLPNFNQFF